MIVKDEEKFIEQCINSVREHVDEIIVVDTGSKDNTLEIAQRLGAKVYTFEWVDDFSAARNFSLSKATSDWILVMDPDEIIAEKDAERVKQTIQTTAISAFQFNQRTYTNNSEQASWKRANLQDENTRGFLGYVDIPITRLFVNDKNLKFTGRVHEDITTSIKENKLPILKSDIIIHHYEYSKGRDFVADKQLYYLDLTLRKIKEQPKDPKAYADAGIIYYNYKKDWDKALIYFKKAIEIDPNYKSAYNYLARIYTNKGQKDEAGKILQRCIDKGINDALVYFNLAKLFMGKKKMDEAISLLKKATEINQQDNNNLNLRAEMFYILGEAYMEKGEMFKAIDVFKKSLGINPKHLELYARLANLYEKTGNFKEALKFLKILVKINPRQILTEKIYEIENKLYK